MVGDGHGSIAVDIGRANQLHGRKLTITQIRVAMKVVEHPISLLSPHAGLNSSRQNAYQPACGRGLHEPDATLMVMEEEMELTDLGGLYASRPDLYDLMHADVQDDARFVGEFARLLGEAPRVLELGCGTGRLLLPLLEAGATVVGLDREPAMLEVARSRLTGFAERLSLVQAEMRRFHLDKQFDMVLVGLNTFMHLLTPKQQITCLESIHSHLRPAGVLLLDLACPHAVVRETPASVVQHRFTRS